MKASQKLLLACVVLVLSPASPRADEYKIKQAEIERLSTQMKEEFAGLHYLLNPYQIRQFLSLDSDEERVSWIELYWKQRDPTPTTPENEMEIEHNIRVKIARQAYRLNRWPGWDKRGEVFIRYGPPNYLGKLWGDINVRGMEPPGELWYYTRHNMLVSFQNFGLNGEFIYSIDPLGPATKFSPELTEFLLYDTNELLSQQIPQQYLEYYAAPAYAPVPQSSEPGREEAYMMSRERVLDPGIDAIMDPDRVDMLPSNVMDVFQRDKIREVANNFEITLEDTPSSYPFNFEQKPLPFYFAVDQFRGGDEKNRVDVSLELPVSIGNDTVRDDMYHAQVVIWDADYREVSRRSTDIVIQADESVIDWSSLIPSQIIVALNRGYYRMGISIEGDQSGRSSSYRTTFDCEPYGVRLSISDILFARSITEANSPSMFTRGAMDVVPHPSRAYSRRVSMPIYFEIYNLTLDERGVSSYTLEYKIVPRTNQKKTLADRFQSASPVVSSKFQSSGFGPSESQPLFIRLDNLSKGAYDLLITLTDDVTQQVVTQTGTFSLVD